MKWGTCICRPVSCSLNDVIVPYSPSDAELVFKETCCIEIRTMQVYVMVEEKGPQPSRPSPWFMEVTTSEDTRLVDALQNTLGGNLTHFEIAGPESSTTWQTQAKELKGRQLTLRHWNQPLRHTVEALYGPEKSQARKVSDFISPKLNLCFHNENMDRKDTAIEIKHEIEKLKGINSNPQSLVSNSNNCSPQHNLTLSESHTTTNFASMATHRPSDLPSSFTDVSKEDQFTPDEDTFLKRPVTFSGTAEKQARSTNNLNRKSPQFASTPEDWNMRNPDKEVDLMEELNNVPKLSDFDQDFVSSNQQRLSIRRDIESEPCTQLKGAQGETYKFDAVQNDLNACKVPGNVLGMKIVDKLDNENISDEKLSGSHCSEDSLMPTEDTETSGLGTMTNSQNKFHAPGLKRVSDQAEKQVNVNSDENNWPNSRANSVPVKRLEDCYVPIEFIESVSQDQHLQSGCEAGSPKLSQIPPEKKHFPTSDPSSTSDPKLGQQQKMISQTLYDEDSAIFNNEDEQFLNVQNMSSADPVGRLQLEHPHLYQQQPKQQQNYEWQQQQHINHDHQEYLESQQLPNHQFFYDQQENFHFQQRNFLPQHQGLHQWQQLQEIHLQHQRHQTPPHPNMALENLLLCHTPSPSFLDDETTKPRAISDPQRSTVQTPSQVCSYQQPQALFVRPPSVAYINTPGARSLPASSTQEVVPIPSLMSVTANNPPRLPAVVLREGHPPVAGNGMIDQLGICHPCPNQFPNHPFNPSVQNNFSHSRSVTAELDKSHSHMEDSHGDDDYLIASDSGSYIGAKETGAKNIKPESAPSSDSTVGHLRHLHLPAFSSSQEADSTDNEDERRYSYISDRDALRSMSLPVNCLSQAPAPPPRRPSQPGARMTLEEQLSRILGWCPDVNERNITSTMEKFRSQDGNFVVWQRAQSGEFVVSVSYMNTLRHRLVKTTRGMAGSIVYYLFDGGFRSPSLLELVQHYINAGIKSPIGPSTSGKSYDFDHIRLRYPLKVKTVSKSRNDRELQKD